MMALTSADFLGRSEVAQLQLCYVRTIDEDGSLAIRTSCNQHALVRYRVCTELYGSDLDGTQISVMLHVVDGFCREIEICKVDGSPIQRMPDTWESFVPGPASGIRDHPPEALQASCFRLRGQRAGQRERRGSDGVEAAGGAVMTRAR